LMALVSPGRMMGLSGRGRKMQNLPLPLYRACSSHYPTSALECVLRGGDSQHPALEPYSSCGVQQVTAGKLIDGVEVLVAH
jgi:hypothetical protein